MARANKYEFENLTKSQQDCLTLIESLGIYELRALARVFGDNSPTTLKRNDHITIVMEKIISGEDLRPIPLRQGRPYKELSNIEGILVELSQLTGKDYTIKSNQQASSNRMQKVVTFRQLQEDVVKQKLFPIEAKGVLLERNEKEFYFVNQYNGKSVLVKKDLDIRLKPYDFVSGNAVIMNQDKDYILENLKSINFQTSATYQENNDPYVKIAPTKQVQLLNNKVLLGARYIYSGKIVENIKAIKEMTTYFKENKIISLALVSNVMEEDQLTLESAGFNNLFILKYEDSPFTFYETTTTFVEHVTRLQNLGYKIAIFVEDITTLANGIDFSFKNNTKALMGRTETTVNLIKQLILLACAGGENKHTTLFVSFDEPDMFDQMYVSSVYKVSKKFEI